MQSAAFRAIRFLIPLVAVAAWRDGSATARPLASTVVVRVFDNFGVAPAELAHALDEARGIFLHADVDIIWRNCSGGPEPRPSACGEVPAPNELLVRLVASPTPAASPQRVSLGSSLLDLEGAHGVLGTVFPDRVQLIAHVAGVDGATVLGRVVAHEAGHLLLGAATHAERGLMRGFWSPQSLQHGTPDDWRFSTSESASMRNGLLARLVVQDGLRLAAAAAGCNGAPELSSPACDGSFGGISTGSSALR
jgi:hypothetical protein